jgi:hypothetical protein
MDEDLKTQCAAMSDDEMLSLGNQYASLTDDAQLLVREEFKRRNLETPDAEEDQAPDALLGVKTIRQYRDQAEAMLARSALESSGIKCFLRDENTIRIDWLWSNLMGGIRLQVAEADVEAAEAILSQPIPENVEVAGEADFHQPVCPNCGSLNSRFNNLDAKVAATSILLLGFPVPAPPEKDFWHCNECGTNWVDEANSLVSE